MSYLTKMFALCQCILLGRFHLTVGSTSDCRSIDHEIWPQGYKTFFMLNSAEHEIFSANKYENANNSWHFHIY